MPVRTPAGDWQAAPFLTGAPRALPGRAGQFVLRPVRAQSEVVCGVHTLHPCEAIGEWRWSRPCGLGVLLAAGLWLRPGSGPAGGGGQGGTGGGRAVKAGGLAHALPYGVRCRAKGNVEGSRLESGAVKPMHKNADATSFCPILRACFPPCNGFANLPAWANR